MVIRCSATHVTQGSLEFRIRNGPNDATVLDYSFVWAKAEKSGTTTQVEFQYGIPSEGVDWTTLDTLSSSTGTIGSWVTVPVSGSVSVSFPKSVWVHFRLYFSSMQSDTKTSSIAIDNIVLNAYSGNERDEEAADVSHRPTQCNAFCDRVPGLRDNPRVNCC